MPTLGAFAILLGNDLLPDILRLAVRRTRCYLPAP
jgi:hypothetical protein